MIERDNSPTARWKEVLQRFDSSEKSRVCSKTALPKCLKINDRLFCKIAKARGFFAKIEKSRRPRPGLPGSHRPTLSRSCRPRTHSRSGAQETPQNLPGRAPQTQSQALSGYRQTLSLQVPRRYPPNRPKPPRLAPQKDALRPAFFLPRSSSRRNSSLSVGQSYKDFYVVGD